MKNFIILLTIITFNAAIAQKSQVHNYNNIKPADWIIPKTDTVSYSFGNYLGQKALIMKRKFGNYKAGTVIYPKNLLFKDGTIEMDVAWGGKRGGYLGLAFRIKDAHHYECVYFRPESSGTINAMQYMPEKKADFNWWNYESEKYQAKTVLPLNGWFHIKAVVKGSKLTMYANGQPKPIFIYNALDKSLDTGSAGFWFGNSEMAAYNNLTITTD
jgi:hypothetical protein